MASAIKALSKPKLTGAGLSDHRTQRMLELIASKFKEGTDVVARKRRLRSLRKERRCRTCSRLSGKASSKPSEETGAIVAAARSRGPRETMVGDLRDQSGPDHGAKLPGHS